MARRRGCSRRHLLGAAGLFAGIGLLPMLSRPALAAPGERKFLFFFASGGWDVAYVFNPIFGSQAVDMDPLAELAQVGDLRFVRGDDRPAVERYFSRWGHRSTIINGIDMHSIGHDSGTRFALTGTSASSTPDWPTLLAARSQLAYPLPHLVMSGPAYPGGLGNAVVRGGGGTLLDLLDGSINGQTDRPAPVMPTVADSMIDAVVAERTAGLAAQRAGLGRHRLEEQLTGLAQGVELEARQFEASLSGNANGILAQARMALQSMRLGLARCAMVRVPGGWDSHGNNDVQGPAFDNLFNALDQLMDELATTPGDATARLIDEVVIVCMSEIGRTPKYNGGGGKDHWPFGSFMVAGSGVAGGQVLGATDDRMLSLPIDLGSGQPHDSGVRLGTEHVGAALLALGGLDPAEYVPGIDPLMALLA